DCDARVVGKGASLKNYAQLLVNQARARIGAPVHLWLGATSLLEPASHLERRLRAMVTPDNKHSAKRPFARALRSASYIAIVSTLAIAACESHVPTAADISGLDAASAEKNVRQVFLTKSDAQQPTYYVDGVVVSAEKAKSVSSDSIATVNIIRSKQPNGEQQIRLVTVAGVRLGKDGAAMDSVPRVMFLQSQPGTVKLRTTGKVLVMTPANEPLFLIDGVVATTVQYKALNPANIDRIEVTKGAAALKQSSDPRAANGIVSITLKH
ncbi:MAG: TonB-dependent receptor plug domain-containing protein, partial [Gemmatimonadaceae bacterium]